VNSTPINFCVSVGERVIRTSHVYDGFEAQR